MRKHHIKLVEDKEAIRIIHQNQNPTKNKEDMIKKLREENINESEIEKEYVEKRGRRTGIQKKANQKEIQDRSVNKNR